MTQPTPQPEPTPEPPQENSVVREPATIDACRRDYESGGAARAAMARAVRR